MGGLVSISSQTLNLTDLTHALIKVERNLCGFLPASIPFSDGDQLQIALNFEPRYQSSLAPAIPSNLHLDDLTNPIDRNRVMEGLLQSDSSPEDPVSGACSLFSLFIPARDVIRPWASQQFSGSAEVSSVISPPAGSIPKANFHTKNLSFAQPNPDNILLAPQSLPLPPNGSHILKEDSSRLGPQPIDSPPNTPLATLPPSPPCKNTEITLHQPSSKPLPFPKVYSRRKKNANRPIPEVETSTNPLVPASTDSPVNPSPFPLVSDNCSFSIYPLPGKRLNFDQVHLVRTSLTQNPRSPASDSSLSLSSEDSDFSSTNSSPQKVTPSPIHSPNLAEFFDTHSQSNQQKNSVEIGIPCPENLIPDHLSSLVDLCSLKLKLLSPISASA